MSTLAADDPELHELLLSHKKRSLALPETTTFEPLRPVATNVPLRAEDSLFATHTTYQMPIDGLHVRPGQPLDCPGLVDTIHRFAVKRQVAAPLCNRLTEWALHKERRGKDAEGRLGLVKAGKGSDAGVQKTNVGGYQSFHDLFDEDPADEESNLFAAEANGDGDCDDGGGDGDEKDDEDEDASAPEWLRRSKRDCMLVRDIVSAAIDEAGGDAYPGEAAARQPPPGGRHASYGWLNVNRSADSNFMHTHQVDLWSAVFYVCEGEPNAPGFPSPCGGHMVFRGGARPAGEGGPALAADGAPCRTYLAVPPQPGTLWLFPGSLPHLVMRRLLPPGVAEPEVPRISIGVNFDFAVPPLPSPWRPPAQPEEPGGGDDGGGGDGGGGEAAAARTARAAKDAAAAARHEGNGNGNGLPGDGGGDGGAERERREEWVEAAAQTQLIMGEDEARERGFGPDEEVVMPLPVWSDSDDDQ